MAKRPTKSAKPAAAPASRQLTVEEVQELVNAWDNARAELKAAGDLVADIQTRLGGLDADADRAGLDGDLVAAQARVVVAQAAIEALTPLPEGVRLPDARPNAEIPAGPQGGTDTTAQGPGDGNANDAAVKAAAVAGALELLSLDAQFLDELAKLAAEFGISHQGVLEAARAMLTGRDDLSNDMVIEGASVTHTTSESDGSEGEPGNSAGLTLGDIDRMVGLEVARVGESVRSVVKTDPEGALAHVAEERRRAQLMISMAGLINAELAAIELEIVGTIATAPIEHLITVTAKLDSRWRIGRQFSKAATVFEAGALGADELIALKADPMLVVVEGH